MKNGEEALNSGKDGNSGKQSPPEPVERARLPRGNHFREVSPPGRTKRAIKEEPTAKRSSNEHRTSATPSKLAPSSEVGWLQFLTRPRVFALASAETDARGSTTTPWFIVGEYKVTEGAAGCSPRRPTDSWRQPRLAGVPRARFHFYGRRRSFFTRPRCPEFIWDVVPALESSQGLSSGWEVNAGEGHSSGYALDPPMPPYFERLVFISAAILQWKEGELRWCGG
ncbi:hypothetical protein KM043_002101 [Ampulex compressa]|nr:hypothetical protein KM043_002101 [Ampulex compressa]